MSMLSVPGVYKNGTITLLEPIPNLQSASVIVTVLEQNPLAHGMATKMTVESWLGNMQGTAWILGDIVEPIEDSLTEWLVLQE
jgi:hypothetical protein